MIYDSFERISLQLRSCPPLWQIEKLQYNLSFQAAPEKKKILGEVFQAQKHVLS